MSRTLFALRKALPEDEPFLFELYASTRQEELAPVPWSPAQKEAFLRMQVQAQRSSYAAQFPDAEHQIILREGRPAGRLLVDRNGERLLVVDIALLPGDCGHGIGGALLADLLREAGEVGRRVELSVYSGNAAARLYERLGFKTIQEDGLYSRMEWRP